ncbi:MULTISPECIES: hypothetical protein [Enterobacterales]|uniref:hypothetical protein n=3 Tax=Gammaproteobacteria TaxID=1236 RepID=UPI000847EF63|nr:MULTISPECIES: hypothetical protein [Enterobacterales]MCK9782057.1 hypothetical protein [Proteus columbae]ODQ07539.1 hypothetical protein BGK50_14975 [Shigella sp. FC130]OEI95082.1 hypothetical protein BHE86_13970 [Shigella sp. FC1655]
MKIETKEERLQKIMQGEKDALALEPPSYSVQSQAVIDADVKIEFNQLKSSPEEPDNEVKMNRVIEYEVIITGIELRLAEWRTSPKGILILPNNKDVYISIVDDNKTKISLTGNRNGVASLQLILKDEDDESIVYYATPIQIRVTPSKPNPNNDCAASNCETFYDLLTIRSESMQWPSKWDNVSKSFVVHLQDKEGEDVSNKEVNLVYDVENSTLMSEPEIYNSDGEMSNASKTNKYGIANFKVKFKKSEPKQIAIFYAEVKSSEDPLESLKSRDYYVEMTTEKLPSPKVPATLNGILSYHAENYCVNANLILGRDISESTQVGFYFNDQLKMLPCTDKSAVSVRLENQLLTNGIHYISFFTVDIFDNVCFSRRERIIIDNSLTGECSKQIKNIAPKPCISVTIPQICDRYFNSINIRLVPSLCLQIKNRVSQMNIQKMVIIFNGYSKVNGSERTLVYRSTLEIYSDDPRLGNFLHNTTPNNEPINMVEIIEPALESILADALPNIEVGQLGIQVMIFEKTGNCYLCGENMYTVSLRLPCA